MIKLAILKFSKLKDESFLDEVEKTIKNISSIYNFFSMTTAIIDFIYETDEETTYTISGHQYRFSNYPKVHTSPAAPDVHDPIKSLAYSEFSISLDAMNSTDRVRQIIPVITIPAGLARISIGGLAARRQMFKQFALLLGKKMEYIDLDLASSDFLDRFYTEEEAAVEAILANMSISGVYSNRDAMYDMARRCLASNGALVPVSETFLPSFFASQKVLNNGLFDLNNVIKNLGEGFVRMQSVTIYLPFNILKEVKEILSDLPLSFSSEEYIAASLHSVKVAISSISSFMTIDISPVRASTGFEDYIIPTLKSSGRMGSCVDIQKIYRIGSRTILNTITTKGLPLQSITELPDDDYTNLFQGRNLFISRDLASFVQYPSERDDAE